MNVDVDMYNMDDDDDGLSQSSYSEDNETPDMEKIFGIAPGMNEKAGSAADMFFPTEIGSGLTQLHRVQGI